MTGYRLHEVLVTAALFALLFLGLSVRGCQEAEALRVQRLELARFHEELQRAYGREGDPAAPRPAPSGYRLDPAPPGQAARILVDLNTADERVLEGLPGIGAERARAILEARLRLGGFRSLEELATVRGIGDATLERLRPLVTLGPPPHDAEPTGTTATGADDPPARPTPPPYVAPHPTAPPAPALAAPTPHHGPININTAGVEELSLLEGIGEGKARAIIQHRQQHGPFRSPQDLLLVRGIGEKTLARNIHRITVR